MTKRERHAVVTRIEKIRDKRNKLHKEITMMTAKGQIELNKMAKDTCPYKKGDVFKEVGRNVWAQVKFIAAAKVQHGLRPTYWKHPYILECLRCSVKGVIQKDKWVFIYGADIDSKWIKM